MIPKIKMREAIGRYFSCVRKDEVGSPVPCVFCVKKEKEEP